DKLRRDQRASIRVLHDARIVAQHLRAVAGDGRAQLGAGAALRHDGVDWRSGRPERHAEPVRHRHEDDQHRDHQRNPPDREHRQLSTNVETANVVGHRDCHYAALNMSVIRARYALNAGTNPAAAPMPAALLKVIAATRGDSDRPATLPRMRPMNGSCGRYPTVP